MSICSCGLVYSSIQLWIDLLHSISDERMRCNAICQVQAPKARICQPVKPCWNLACGWPQEVPKVVFKTANPTLLTSYAAVVNPNGAAVGCSGLQWAAWHVPRNRKRTSSMWPCHAARSRGVSPAWPDTVAIETTGTEQDLHNVT